MSKQNERLLDAFVPEHYDVHVTLDRKAMRFSTKVTISGKKVGRPSKRLTFHARHLKITDATITRHDKKGDQTINVARLNLHKKYEEVRLHSDSQLYPGQYTVTMTATGSITTVMQGLYPCFFKDKKQEKFLLATQFESHHAREVVPCIDEPSAKATFQLTVTTDKQDTVLSNTPIKTENIAADSKTVLFEPTPRMSSYLLAFVAGEMHCQEATTKDGVLVRSWASINRDKKLLTYSVEEAVRVLEFYEDYFGVPYPLAKCDQVALPDFDAGAMENWGLITYREIALLADPDNRSISSEQYVSLVVAHELSHQWFGNLVTMKWWDDLWLNESFASIMEHLSLDHIHPDWHQWEQYVTMDVLATTSRDIYKDIQPVGVTVTDPALIETLFDPGIVYAKGGRLLKMLKDFIGDQDFQQGLKQYFTDFAYQNTSREDLWQALSQASGQDISAIMTPWLEKPGMPLIEATQRGNHITLRQQRFLLDGEDKTSLWPVPLLFDGTKEHLLLHEASQDFEVAHNDYVVLNKYASGHYFTHYTEKAHRQWVTKQLEQQTINPEARINILNDMYMLARGGQASLREGLDAIIGCTQEPRDAVWSMVSRLLGAASQLTDGDKTAEKQLRAVKGILADYWYQQLGWDDQPNDNPNTRQLRHTALAYKLASEDRDALAKATSIFDTATSLEDIHAEHRTSILSANVRHGDKAIITKLMDAYSDASADVQQDIAIALSSTKDSEQAHFILSKALGPQGFVRAQDVMRWIAYFMRNFYTRDVAWEYMVTNWQWLQETLERSKSFDFLPIYCANPLSTKAGLKKYQEFFEGKKDIKVLEKNIGIGLNDIKARVAWRERDEAKIKTWLAKHSN